MDKKDKANSREKKKRYEKPTMQSHIYTEKGALACAKTQTSGGGTCGSKGLIFDPTDLS